jgi:hypothetical protein
MPSPAAAARGVRATGAGVGGVRKAGVGATGEAPLVLGTVLGVGGEECSGMGVAVGVHAGSSRGEAWGRSRYRTLLFMVLDEVVVVASVSAVAGVERATFRTFVGLSVSLGWE